MKYELENIQTIWVVGEKQENDNGWQSFTFTLYLQARGGRKDKLDKTFCLC